MVLEASVLDSLSLLTSLVGLELRSSSLLWNFLHLLSACDIVQTVIALCLNRVVTAGLGAI